MFEKMTLTGPRFEKLLRQNMKEVEQAEQVKETLGRPFNIETDMELMPPAVQTALLFRVEKSLREHIAAITLGFVLAPEDSIALIFALGYAMGKEDARATSEMDELAKLFALPSEPQGETNA